jgi:hypothetical protein
MALDVIHRTYEVSIMQLSKDLVGKYLNLLLQSVPTCEVKILSVEGDEITCEYDDGEVLHVDSRFLVAYWVNEKRASRVLKAKAAAATKKAIKDEN